MGMLDGLLGSLLGGSNASSQAQNPLLQVALQLLQQNGGIGGVVEKFRQSGYGQQADSWVSTGENHPIAPEAVPQALGSGTLADVASQLGLSQGAAAGGLASMLPQLIDQLTPHGHIVGGDNDAVAQLLSQLKQGRP